MPRGAARYALKQIVAGEKIARDQVKALRCVRRPSCGTFAAPSDNSCKQSRLCRQVLDISSCFVTERRLVPSKIRTDQLRLSLAQMNPVLDSGACFVPAGQPRSSIGAEPAALDSTGLHVARRHPPCFQLGLLAPAIGENGSKTCRTSICAETSRS